MTTHAAATTDAASLLQDITSGNAQRIWSSACAINQLRDAKALDPLAAALPEIREKTRGVALGGAFFPNEVHLNVALHRLDYHRRRAGCLCRLYPEHLFYEPAKEAANGHVSIEGVTYIDGKWVEAYACTCRTCGTRFRVEEGESHYLWWSWKIVA